MLFRAMATRLIRTCWCSVLISLARVMLFRDQHRKHEWLKKKEVLISLARVMLFREHGKMKLGVFEVVLISLARVMLFRAPNKCVKILTKPLRLNLSCESNAFQGMMPSLNWAQLTSES